MDKGSIIMLIIVICLFIGIISIPIIWKARTNNKEKNYINELTKRLPYVDYTEIISSSNGVSTEGISSFNFNTRATTKFLVVYKSGQKHIVLLDDNSPLFNEYVKLLKK